MFFRVIIKRKASLRKPLHSLRKRDLSANANLRPICYYTGIIWRVKFDLNMILRPLYFVLYLMLC